MTDHQVPEEARQLLDALRAAGSVAFVNDGQFFCSPPPRLVAWPGDVEEDIFLWADELAQLVAAESASALLH